MTTMNENQPNTHQQEKDMTNIGRCACDASGVHEVCDDRYLDAPLFAPSKAQLEAERKESQ